MKILDDNNLLTWCVNHNRDDLIHEYNTNKNTLPMSEYSAGSSKKIWWICEKGHEWQGRIYNRTHLHSGCHECANMKQRGRTGEKKTINALAWCRKNNLEYLIEEYNNIKNKKSMSDYSFGTKTKVWWKCRFCGYEWNARMYNRLKLGRGCPNFREHTKIE